MSEDPFQYLQQSLDKNLYHQIVYFKDSRYPALDGKYWFITACLYYKEYDYVLISFFNENEECKWTNINMSPEESISFMVNSVERCEGDQFDSAREEAIIMFNRLLDKIR
jgi:hypothetical protein